MRAQFNLMHHLPTHRSFLVQWPGRSKFLPKVGDLTLLASTKPGGTPDLVAALGGGMVTHAMAEREVVELTEEQALRALLLIELLGPETRKGASTERLVAYVTSLDADQARYWATQLCDPAVRDRTRRAMTLMVG